MYLVRDDDELPEKAGRKRVAADVHRHYIPHQIMPLLLKVEGVFPLLQTGRGRQ